MLRSAAASLFFRLQRNKPLQNASIYEIHTSIGRSKSDDNKITSGGDSEDTPTSYSGIRKKREPGLRRVVEVVAGDFRNLRKGNFSGEPDIPNHVDIVVIGGGIIGSSIAYWLKQRSPASFSLMVIERDETYAHSSTALSVGGIRQQFSLPENIEMSLYSAEFLRNIKKNLSVLDHEPPDISFQHQGYLFLATEAGVENMKKNNKIQKELGAKVELMTATELKERFPWIDTEGIAMGSYGLENEGWFDPWSLLMAFKRKSLSLGVKYINGEAVDFEFKTHEQSPFVDDDSPYKSVNTVLVKSGDEIHEVHFAILIVCGGANSGKIARMLNIGKGKSVMSVPFPVEPRKRYVYCVHCENGPVLDVPLLIDYNGAYCRREGLGGHYLVGKSPDPSEEPECKNLDVDYNYFENTVWPLLHQRIPAFEALKIKSAWAGYYDYNTFDQNGIIGRHPYYGNVFFATGFSGHGLQMAPSIGRAMMEMLIDGQFVTIDLSRFGCNRFILGEPIFEDGIV